MPNFKKIPKFKNEDEERKFWATHSRTDHVDWKSAQRVHFPNLKATTLKQLERIRTRNKNVPLKIVQKDVKQAIRAVRRQSHR